MRHGWGANARHAPPLTVGAVATNRRRMQQTTSGHGKLYLTGRRRHVSDTLDSGHGFSLALEEANKIHEKAKAV